MKIKKLWLEILTILFLILAYVTTGTITTEVIDITAGTTVVTGTNLHGIFGILASIAITIHVFKKRKWMAATFKNMKNPNIVKAMKQKYFVAVLLFISWYIAIILAILSAVLGSYMLGEIHGVFVIISIAITVIHFVQNKKKIFNSI
ncbi:MAG: hypothetical protein FWF57_02335 [Defluviitaleaceae bacterium]|nr:hypothetical protein [Defluviitaleaceae bacterium]